ncbi:tumor necrosis factor receptor superfamily member 4 [Heterocephalus glaber]|uniref:Tumor necrosis factor receptor superfamily member 4 n=1 Tax=Heterocephalus glaber TaxID=10181 RepID=A0AAX6RQS2_HETGA|nr:tumor necrosis factor receptor superfamily member 4 [Heterocephalus glaber]
MAPQLGSTVLGTPTSMATCAVMTASQVSGWASGRGRGCDTGSVSWSEQTRACQKGWARAGPSLVHCIWCGSATGNKMVRRCRGGLDSVCLPCDPGFYNEAVNYEGCKPCTHCNRRSGSEVKQNCTPTQDTVCHCRPGTQPLDGFKHGVDCKPCPPGHFSLGSNQACKPWTDCASTGKQTLKQGSSSSDAICEDRSHLATMPWETQGPTARTTKARPTTAQPTMARPTAAWAWTSQVPFMPPSEAPSGEGLLGTGRGRAERAGSCLLASWTYSAGPSLQARCWLLCWAWACWSPWLYCWSCTCTEGLGCHLVPPSSLVSSGRGPALSPGG